MPEAEEVSGNKRRRMGHSGHEKEEAVEAAQEDGPFPLQGEHLVPGKAR
jgi:hypothetical protein